jgi:hypothetical protein
MMTRVGIVFGLAAFLLAAHQVRAAENKLPDRAKTILDKAKSYELFSLDPRKDEEKEEKGKDNFHGYKVLGKTTVKDAKDREKLLTALAKGIKESKGEIAKCFDPRHGIRATHDGQTVDLVICFECLQVYVYYGKGDKRAANVLTTRSPEATLDKILKDAGVKLSPKPKE